MTENKGSSKSPQDSRKPPITEAELIDIMGALSDKVTSAVLTCIAETGECLKKDLETLDAVVEEGESDIAALKELGLIEVEKSTIALTEKGRKVLAYIEGWSEK